jgi:hypothetical protein
MKAYLLAFGILLALGGAFIVTTVVSPPAMADNANGS